MSLDIYIFRSMSDMVYLTRGESIQSAKRLIQKSKKFTLAVKHILK